MTTIEERAKRICANTFCNQSHTPVCKTCAWRLNSEPAEPQCRVLEYKDVIKDIYESAICQLILQREELIREYDLKEKPHIEAGNCNTHFGNWGESPIHVGFCPVSEPLSKLRSNWRRALSTNNPEKR